MPSTVASLFAAAGLTPAGVVRWMTPPQPNEPGVYVVALTDKADSFVDAVERFPVARPRVAELLRARPELRVDGHRPDVDELSRRLDGMWLGDEVVVYVGLAGTSLRRRVGDFYKTPLGARRPHAGGWPLKTLDVLDELWVHFTPCANVRDAEHLMLGSFIAAVTDRQRAKLRDPSLPIPFANLEWARGQRKVHGITGAREPSTRTLAST